MATVKLKFRRLSPSGDEGVLYLQVIHNREVRRMSTGRRIFAAEWDESRSAIIVPPSASPRAASLAALSSEMALLVSRFDDVIARLARTRRPYTASAVMDAVRGCPSGKGFLAFVADVAAGMSRAGRVRLAAAYRASAGRFARFCGIRDVPFDCITAELLDGFEASLHADGLCRNTSSFYMRNLRAVYNRAVECGLVAGRQPFRHVYTGVEYTRKRAVPLSVVRRLCDMSLAAGSTRAFARDMFIFSFLTRGMSFVDMAFLKKSDVAAGKLRYMRRKTGRRLTVKWESPMQDIVDRYSTAGSPYLLPIIKTADGTEYAQYQASAHKVSRHLRLLGAALGLPQPLTMYVARHTWASAARGRNIAMTVISEAMGHDSERTTRIYLASLDSNAIDSANSDMIRLIFTEEETTGPAGRR